MNPRFLTSPSVILSLTMAVLAFGIDRAHKAVQVSADCIAIGEARCVEVFTSYVPFSMTGWPIVSVSCPIVSLNCSV